MGKLSKNSVSLAGEFAVLSQLALRGHDANLTLGNTKNVDILVAASDSAEMHKLEVKTNYKAKKTKPAQSTLFGRTYGEWMMSKKHEGIVEERLFYCFVNIFGDGTSSEFFIVPSHVVADYVREQHKYWLKADRKHKDVDIRAFRVGAEKEKYPIRTPLKERYQNNWEFTWSGKPKS